MDVTIPAEFMQRLDEASSIELGFPLDFYREGRAGWFGEHLDRLDPRARPLGRRVMGLDEIARRPPTSG